MHRRDLEGLYPPCFKALYISMEAKAPIMLAIMTIAYGKNSAGTNNNSTNTVNIMPVIILCLNLSLTVFL